MHKWEERSIPSRVLACSQKNFVFSNKDVVLISVRFAIDLASGQKKETISFHGSDSVCPQGRAGLAYIGRSEYHIAMFDAATGERRWNATYYDYAATAANILEVAHAEYGEWKLVLWPLGFVQLSIAPSTRSVL